MGCRCPICSNYGDAAFAVLQHGGWRDWGHIQRECPIPPQLNIPGEGCRGQLPLTSKPNKIHGYWCCSCDGNSACVYQNTAFCLPMNSTPCAYAEKRGKARPLYRLPRVQATPYCSYPKSGRPPPLHAATGTDAAVRRQPRRRPGTAVQRGGRARAAAARGAGLPVRASAPQGPREFTISSHKPGVAKSDLPAGLHVSGTTQGC